VIGLYNPLRGIGMPERTKDKREVIREVLDEVDEPWIIMKPSRHNPTDTDTLCVFENPHKQTQAKANIPMDWFEKQEVEKIKEAVLSSLQQAELLAQI